MLRVKKHKLFVFSSYVLFIINMFRFLLRTNKCKQWLEHQQSCENHSFWIGGLEDLVAISVTDM
jgi:hypothetical protein